ncbi:MAG: SDR family NAD(P)-dependent oxidoreductase [Methylococcaceae bacterium]|nr:SDR family NAD(P)-dependent oxidoreductase [Methylococcaceae bacterium]
MKLSTKFQNQVVIVTGASSGIGRATALAFAREGATTVLASRSVDKLEQVADEIRRFNPKVRVIPTDVSSREQVVAMVDKVLAELKRIDVLVNNAGSASVGRFDGEGFVADAQNLMAVDFYGGIYCAQAVLPIMRRQRSGHIVNLSSVVGRKAFPQFGAYSAAMHAIAAYSDALRQELRGTGIGVSIIHPALTQTALLDKIDPADLPPPFRRMTPISAEAVAKGIVGAVRKNRPRVILPWQPKLMLVADALSARVGDLIVRLLSTSVFPTFMGLYRGRTYQYAVSTRTDQVSTKVD